MIMIRHHIITYHRVGDWIQRLAHQEPADQGSDQGSGQGSKVPALNIISLIISIIISIVISIIFSIIISTMISIIILIMNVKTLIISMCTIGLIHTSINHSQSNIYMVVKGSAVVSNHNNVIHFKMLIYDETLIPDVVLSRNRL